MLKIRNTVTEINSVFKGIISSLSIAKKKTLNFDNRKMKTLTN